MNGFISVMATIGILSVIIGIVIGLIYLGDWLFRIKWMYNRVLELENKKRRIRK